MELHHVGERQIQECWKRVFDIKNIRKVGLDQVIREESQNIWVQARSSLILKTEIIRDLLGLLFLEVFGAFDSSFKDMVDQEGFNESFELIRLLAVFEDVPNLLLHSLVVLLLAVLKHLANGRVELQFEELGESVFGLVSSHQRL